MSRWSARWPVPAPTKSGHPSRRATPSPFLSDVLYAFPAARNGGHYSGSSPFAATLAAAERPAVLVGTGALNDGGVHGPAVEALARKVAADAGALTDEWNGYAVLQPTSAATGALDVGFVPGPTALPLSKLKVVYLLGEDGLALHDMASDAFVVYQGHHGDAGAESADLVLPAAAYTEQSGTYVNTEGRVQRGGATAF